MEDSDAVSGPLFLGRVIHWKDDMLSEYLTKHRNYCTSKLTLKKV
jgi:hypothetical protein